MKMMKHTLTKDSQDAIDAQQMSINMDLAHDLLSIWEVTPLKASSNLKTFDDVMKEVIGGKFVDVDELINNIFDYRRDLKRFINNPAFFNYLEANIQDAAEIRKAILEIAEMITVAKTRTAPQPNKGNSSTGTVIDEEESLDASEISIVQAQSQELDYFSNLLNGLIFIDYAQDGEGGGSGYGRFMRKGGQELKLNPAKNSVVRDKIGRVVKWLMSGDNKKIFELANNFKAEFDKKDAVKTEEAKIGDTEHIRRMRTIGDMKNMSSSDKVLPDEVLDNKIAKKDVRVVQPDKKNKEGQNLFALIDKSGSMAGPKLDMAKALLIALGLRSFKNNIDRFDFMAFDDVSYKRVSISKNDDWIDFVDSVIAIRGSGGTNLHRSLSDASNEIKSKALTSNEIVIITDGTEPIDKEEFERRVPFPAHCLLLGSYNKEFVDGYRGVFKTVIHSKAESLEEAGKSGLEFIDVI